MKLAILLAVPLAVCCAPAAASAGPSPWVGAARAAAGAPARPEAALGESDPQGEDDEGPAAEPDLSAERALLEQSQAALARSDYAAARAHVAKAVSVLLARPAAEQGPAWVDALDSAGHLAWDARATVPAKQAWERVLEVHSRTLPEEHVGLQKSRLRVALAIKTLGDLAGARALEELVLEVYSRTLPEEHPDLQAARQNLAVTIKALGDLHGARALEERVLEVCSRTLPEEHPLLQRARQNLAGTMAALGERRAALALFEQVLEVHARTLPESHLDLLRARLNVAVALADLGELREARALLEQVLEVGTRTLPDEHPDLQLARMNLARTIRELGGHAEANALDRKVLEVRSRTLPSDHPDLQLARLNLGVSTYSLGNLAEARVLFEQVVEVFSRTLPEEHPNLQKALGNLALTVRALGDLHAARALQERVLEIRSRTLPEGHTDIQLARLNLGATTFSFGDLAGARALFEDAVEGLSRALPEDHHDLQAARGNLALALKELGDLVGARALDEKTLEVLARTRPEHDSTLQWARLNLAGTMAALGELDAARALEEQVLAVRSATLPERHPDLQPARANLAVTLHRLGELEAARALEEQVLADCEQSLPDEHPRLRTARQNLALTLLELADNAPAASAGEEVRAKAELERALALLAALARAQVRAAREAKLSAPAREAEERCTSLAESLGLVLSAALGYGGLRPLRELEGHAFTYSESVRNAGLAAGSLARAAASSPRHSALRTRLREAGEQLALLAQGGTTSGEFRAALRERDAAEVELMDELRESSVEAAAQADLDASSLGGELEAGAAAVAYRRFTRTKGADRPAAAGKAVESLCAFVVRPASASAAGGAPSLVLLDLGPIEPIERAVEAWREALGAAGGRGVSVGSGAPTREIDERGDELRTLLFDPLAPALGDARRIVLALDDLLHLVPFEALPAAARGAQEGSMRELLGERFRFEVRSSLDELHRRAREPRAGVLVALGGASFDTEPEDFTSEKALLADASPTGTEPVATILRGGAFEHGFEPLSHAELEARELAELHRRTFGADAIVLAGREASRGSLAKLAPLAHWFHVATHGWYASESIRSWQDLEPLDAHTGLGLRQSGEEQVRGSSPMLLCGLALAGANLPEDAVGRAPGLMTAEELSTLDLTSCELAVLSACDTNVGQRRAGQGVASLQRALQMAGARSVITSLWKVPDEATRELMLDFYRRLWVEGKPKHQALWEAKMRLRDAKDERGEPLYTMRDWAAWVLTGEPD